MLKKIFKIVKKVLIATLLIYTYDVIASSLNVTIPINYVNVLLVTFLGVPSLILLVVMKLIFF